MLLQVVLHVSQFSFRTHTCSPRGMSLSHVNYSCLLDLAFLWSMNISFDVAFFWPRRIPDVPLSAFSPPTWCNYVHVSALLPSLDKNRHYSALQELLLDMFDYLRTNMYGISCPSWNLVTEHPLLWWMKCSISKALILQTFSSDSYSNRYFLTLCTMLNLLSTAAWISVPMPGKLTDS